jgi:hypothetical protein
MDGLSTAAGPIRVGNPRHLAWTVGIFAAALSAIPIVRVMTSTASGNVNKLVTVQHNAALKPRLNVDYYEHQRAGAEPAWIILPPGLFESPTALSGTNATIANSVRRLTPLTVFSSEPSLREIGGYVEPTNRRLPPPGHKE